MPTRKPRQPQQKSPKTRSGSQDRPSWLPQALSAVSFAAREDCTVSLVRRWCRAGRLQPGPGPKAPVPLTWKDEYGNWWIHPQAIRPADARYLTPDD